MLVACNNVPNKRKTAVRKRASDFAFAVFDSVAMINAAHWNSVLAEGSEFLDLHYLRVIENNRSSNIKFRYSLIYKDTRPIAIAYFQIIDFSTENFGSLMDNHVEKEKCIQAIFKEYIKRGVNKLHMRLLLCGNSFVSGEHGFTYVPDVNKTDIIDALADVIYRISRAEKLRGKIAAVLVKDFYEASIPVVDELKEFKYHDFEVEPNMILDLDPSWKSFDDYLSAISKKYRTRARSIIKKAAAIERRDLSADEIAENADKIFELYHNVYLKAKFRLAELSPSYFQEMKKELGEKFVFTGYFKDDQLLAFRSSFLLKHELEAHFIGIDYSQNKELELYQNILYDYVKESISNGSKKLQLGRTASEIKSNIGAKAHELRCYIRHRNPLSNRIIKPFIDYLKPSEWIPRNPFKEE